MGFSRRQREEKWKWCGWVWVGIGGLKCRSVDVKGEMKG